MLGSKSPLSYTEQYEVTTVADGYEYDYIIVRQNPVPTATLLASRPTNKPTGTTVRVEIQTDDITKLSRECETQLLYFNNVIVVNEWWFYDNDFKIIESDLFKVRNKDFPFNGQMHIVLGQVAYPINWSILGLEPIYIPVGLKFDIGSLPVTISREELQYADENIKDKIKQKIEFVYDELFKKYQSQFITNNIFEYISYYNNEDSKKLFLTNDFSIPFKMRGNKIIRPTLIINNKGYKIAKDNIDYLFSFYNVSILKNTVVTYERGQGIDRRDLGYSLHTLYYRTGEINHWSNLYRNNGTIIKRGKIPKKIIKDIAGALGLTFEKITANPSYNSLSSIKTRLKDGALLETYKAINEIDSQIKAALQSYDNVPEAFIAQKKEEQKLLEEERKGNITTYNPSNKKDTLKLDKLLDEYKYVFYIDKNEDSYKIAHYYNLFMYAFNKYFKSQYKLIIISTTTVKKIKKFENVKHIDNVWRVANLYTIFNHLKYNYIASSFNIVKDKVVPVSLYYYDLFKKLEKEILWFNIPNSDIIRTGKELKDGTIEYTNERINIDLYTYFKKQIDNIPRKQSYSIESKLEELKKVYPFLKLLSDLDVTNYEQRIKARELVKTFKLIKLNTKYYGKINEINKINS